MLENNREHDLHLLISYSKSRLCPLIDNVIIDHATDG